MPGAWWRWVGRWTAEENRHEIMIRNYLMVTRAVDPVELERLRMDHMTKGFRRPAMHLLEVLATCSFEEAASAVRHRNIAALQENPQVTAIAERIAVDDELQSVVFADLIAAALDLAPDQTMRAIADRVAGFQVPSVTLPDGRSSDEVLAEAAKWAERFRTRIDLLYVVPPPPPIRGGGAGGAAGVHGRGRPPLAGSGGECSGRSPRPGDAA